ncbi:MAG TPA: hypothetical protein VHS06_08005 [Chloroflexota bacterium]|nr:hypothetical protein [Chloroflexota bacterium]
MLQQAAQSAGRLLEHLSEHAAGGQGEGLTSGAHTAQAGNPLESAIASLRSLVAALHKES